MPERCQRGRLKLSSSGQSCSSAGGAAPARTPAPRRETASSGRRRELARPGSSGRGSRPWGSRGSCQGSRQSSSSSRIQSSLSSTQRPRSPRRGPTPGPALGVRLALRDPGRAPDTPSTSWRPALTRRSMPCSGRREERGAGRAEERGVNPPSAGSDRSSGEKRSGDQRSGDRRSPANQRSSIGQRYRRRPRSQRSRATPTTAMATPLHSRLQKKTATPVAHPR
jgi:hypothetical protein